MLTDDEIVARAGVTATWLPESVMGSRQFAFTRDHLIEFARTLLAAQREADAKICESEATNWSTREQKRVCHLNAAAIRGAGNA